MVADLPRRARPHPATAGSPSQLLRKLAAYRRQNELAAALRGSRAHRTLPVHDLSARGLGLRVLAGQGAQVDTTTAAGRLVFGIFAALAEFERELIRERTVAGLEAARARGRKGRQESSR